MPRLPTCLFLLSFLLSGLLFAQSTPQVIKLQGSLIKSGVGPVTGTVTMTIALHDAPTGGQQLAAVGPMPVDVHEGVYAVDLPFPLSAFGGASRFIEITVNGEVLMPRVLLGSSAFAYVADTLDGHHAADLEESAEIDEKMAAHEAKADPHPTYVLRTGDNMTGSLHVDGVVESAVGFKFPDGTIQMSAAVGGPSGPASLDAKTKGMITEPRASLEAPGGGTTAGIRAPVYLPLSGGSMTGVPTLKPTDVAMVLPAGGKGNATSIEFKSQGNYQNGSWFLQNAGPMTGIANEDHTLIFGYNLKADGANGFSRPLSGEHAVKVGFESGWCGPTCDPATHTGSFEFNIDIDTDLTGRVVTDVRPFFFKYRLNDGSAGDAYSKTLFQVGVADANDAFFTMGGQLPTRFKAGKSASGNALSIQLESNVVFGTDVFTPARVFVDGTVNEIQLRVQGADSQASNVPIFQVESMGATPNFSVYNSGQVRYTSANFTETDTAPNCGIDDFNIYADNSEDVFRICQNGTRSVIATGGGTATGTNTGDVAAGRSLTLSGGSYDADPELYTQTRCLNVNPASPVTDLLFFRADKAITVTGIDCLVEPAGSLEMTLRECDGNAAGCGAIEATVICGTANTTETGGIDAAAVEAGHYLRVLIGRKSGTPVQGLICATFTVDD